MAIRNQATFGEWGPGGTRVIASEDKWDKAAAKAGVRYRVFCSSLADVFEDYREPVVDASGNKIFNWGNESPGDMPEFMELGDIRKRLFEKIEKTPNLDWLLLTKRPENINAMIPDHWVAKLPDNVWVGTSVGYQEIAEKRINALGKVNAKVRFLSCEPLLSELDLSEWAYINTRVEHNGDGDTKQVPCHPLFSWVIVGGESGTNARRCAVGWIEKIVDTCKDAGIPVFVKQMGSHPVDVSVGWPEGTDMPSIGGRINLLDKKGSNLIEWPERLRIREFPI
jgi:hypothetical protein